MPLSEQLLGSLFDGFSAKKPFWEYGEFGVPYELVSVTLRGPPPLLGMVLQEAAQ